MSNSRETDKAMVELLSTLNDINDAKYIFYRRYLETYYESYDSALITDLIDVRYSKNPFLYLRELTNSKNILIGSQIDSKKWLSDVKGQLQICPKLLSFSFHRLLL